MIPILLRIAGKATATQAGVRSLFARWLGGAGSVSAAQQAGFRSLLAFWLGGAGYRAGAYTLSANGMSIAEIVPGDATLAVYGLGGQLGVRVRKTVISQPLRHYVLWAEGYQVNGVVSNHTRLKVIRRLVAVGSRAKSSPIGSTLLKWNRMLMCDSFTSYVVTAAAVALVKHSGLMTNGINTLAIYIGDGTLSHNYSITIRHAVMLTMQIADEDEFFLLEAA